ncbi:MAG: phosphate acyltransferase PlsX [Gammaproteobacteria bacterium]|nr:phosphate acyltransferase PlsX [Gammaproteobacteria bacterium]
MTTSKTISLDAMGGDNGVDVVVSAAVNAVSRYDDIELILVGDQHLLSERLTSHNVLNMDRLHIHHASQQVEMGEPPAQALRMKKDSSMRIAINLLKKGEADAMVSAGNTGALMATGRYVLKTLSGINRPAIMTSIPSLNGHTYMLDLGANVDCKAEHLVQFATMGSVLATAVDEISQPRVGLLNIGQEAIKGNEQVKTANTLLDRSPINYIGYVEGDDIYLGDVDVVVCDGFVGNVVLKTSEGLVKMVSKFARQEFQRSLFSRVTSVLALPALKTLGKRFDPRNYNGASLLGLQGIVIKSHGGADAFAFENAINIARIEAKKDIPRRINSQLGILLKHKRPS